LPLLSPLLLSLVPTPCPSLSVTPLPFLSLDSPLLLSDLRLTPPPLSFPPPPPCPFSSLPPSPPPASPAHTSSFPPPYIRSSLRISSPYAPLFFPPSAHYHTRFIIPSLLPPHVPTPLSSVPHASSSTPLPLSLIPFLRSRGKSSFPLSPPPTFLSAFDSSRIALFRGVFEAPLYSPLKSSTLILPPVPGRHPDTTPTSDQLGLSLFPYCCFATFRM